MPKHLNHDSFYNTHNSNGSLKHTKAKGFLKRLLRPMRHHTKWRDSHPKQMG